VFAVAEKPEREGEPYSGRVSIGSDSDHPIVMIFLKIESRSINRLVDVM
jgi:hypothetical protein